MRTATVDGQMCIVTPSGYVDVAAASGGRFGPSPSQVFPVWDEFLGWARTADLPAGEALGSRRLGPPAPEPAQVFAIGLNYVDHASEVGTEIPSEPATFTKFRSCLTGPNGRLALPAGKVDWEVELVAVVGRHAHCVPVDRAWEYVAGLTVGQDFSERDLQLSGVAPQYSLGKSYPGFGPCGPVLVTPDEFDDPNDLAITCSINGEVVQSSRTSAMAINIPQLVARISAVCALYPGDLIFSGTPSGVGSARQPPRFLEDGDRVVSAIEGIGELVQECYTLRNAAESHVHPIATAAGRSEVKASKR